LAKGKGGKRHQRYLEIEARKPEILAIWEKNNHKLVYTAREAGLRPSTLLGKLHQWGIKTPRQEAAEAGGQKTRARVVRPPGFSPATRVPRQPKSPQYSGQAVSLPAEMPELLVKVFQMMPRRGCDPTYAKRWLAVWDSAFLLLYDSSESKREG